MLFGRRITFAIVVLASQLLLIALAIVYFIQMLEIARNGAIQFIENNKAILSLEIVVTILISLFAIAVFAIQLKRLGERRNGDSRAIKK
jgi:hypothetical protein